MIRNICVFCSASDRIEQHYVAAAEALGRLIAERNHTLVFGGETSGLMGAIARAAHAASGRVVGIIPQGIEEVNGAAHELATQLISTMNLEKRRSVMISRSDAFITLPGGYGTLMEFLEVMTLKQHGRHSKPLVLVNTEGFFDPLLQAFDHYHRTGFASSDQRELYAVAATPEEALDLIESAQPVH